MASYKTKLVGAQGEVAKNGGKIMGVYSALAGDRVWNLRETDINGAVKFKVDASKEVNYSEINVGYQNALFAEVVSGTTGEINITIG